MMKVLFGAGIALMLCTGVAAQEPTCKGCPATYVAGEELQAYEKRAIAENIIDQQVRAVDIGKSNVAIGMVYRTKLTTSVEVAEHDFVSEVYHIISCSATALTGPDLVGKERRPATNTNVKILNGPGN